MDILNYILPASTKNKLLIDATKLNKDNKVNNKKEFHRLVAKKLPYWRREIGYSAMDEDLIVDSLWRAVSCR